jgi:nucleoid DNA-binding protein
MGEKNGPPREIRSFQHIHIWEAKYTTKTYGRDVTSANLAKLAQCNGFYKGNDMNKTEMIDALAAETSMTKADAGRALNAVLDIITHAVAKKEDVQLIGFGTFKAATRAARTGKNPRTGEALKIAAATVPRFTAGAAFKTAVNK